MSKLRPLIETGFLYLRHGQSESNVRGLIGGATDYALTDQGRDEARSAGERLRRQVISAIYTSPLQRAYDTACIVAEAHGGISVNVHDDLRERTLGVWEGQPISEFVRGVTPEGGESIESFRSRIIGSLDTIEAPPSVLLVAHAGVYRVLREYLVGADVPERARNAEPMAFKSGETIGTWRVEVV